MRGVLPRGGRPDSLRMAKGADINGRGGRQWNLEGGQALAGYTLVDAVDVRGNSPHLTENQGVGSSILPWATSQALPFQ